MSHVLIQNKGELPIWGMRLLGLSNKRPDQIGKFGTGLKESIALLARMSKFPIIYSGSCRIDFSIQEIDSQQEICFQLSEQRDRFAPGEWYGLGMHPDFGKHDWDDAWMAFREILCNAIDESGVEDLYHDIISTDPEGIAGATRVYVPVDQDILAAYTSIHERLLPLGKYHISHSVTGFGRTLQKRSKKNLQIYHKGVWVQESPRDSLFDYEIDDLKLNESRSADWYNVNSAIAKLVAMYTVEQVKFMLERLIKTNDGKCYEQEVLQSVSYYLDVETGINWREGFHAMFGEFAVITDNDKFFYDRLCDAGRHPVVISDNGLLSLLKAAGVPSAASVLSREQRRYEALITATPEAQAVFDDVWDKMVAAGLTQGKQKPGLMLFRQRPGQATIVFGEYVNGVCHINMDCSGSAQERMACIEEIAHHISEAEDYSKEFQHFLIECMERMFYDDGSRRNSKDSTREQSN